MTVMKLGPLARTGRRYSAPGKMRVSSKPCRISCAPSIRAWYEFPFGPCGRQLQSGQKPARLEIAQQRTASGDVVPELRALGIAQHRDVRQQHRLVFEQSLGAEILLVHKIEHEAPLQQGAIETLQRLRRVGSAWWPIGGLRSARACISTIGSNGPQRA